MHGSVLPPPLIRPEILGVACFDDKHKYIDDTPRRLEWQHAFPNEFRDIVNIIATLFPATSHETYSRWITLRSDISPEDEKDEVILNGEKGRLTLYPLRDVPIYNYWKTIERLNWAAEELEKSFQNDINHYKPAPPGELRLIKKLLGWFGPADEVIMEGLDKVICELIKTKEAKCYIKAQAAQESVHSEAYSKQIYNIIPVEELDALYEESINSHLVRRVADWVRFWIIAKHPAADIFAAMAFIEGVLFSGLFAAVQHFKVKALFPTVTAYNEYISRDEGVHASFWCFLISDRLKHRPSYHVLKGIADEVVNLSRDFFVVAIPTIHSTSLYFFWWFHLRTNYVTRSHHFSSMKLPTK